MKTTTKRKLGRTASARLRPECAARRRLNELLAAYPPRTWGDPDIAQMIAEARQALEAAR